MVRVGPRSPSSSSHPPIHQARGDPPTAPAGSQAVFSFLQAGPERLRSAPWTSRVLRGAVIGGRGSCGRGEGRGRMRRQERPRSPCPNRFPLSEWVGGWVFVFGVLHLGLSLWPPPAKPVWLLTFMFWARSYLGIWPLPPPQFLPIARWACICDLGWLRPQAIFLGCA